jgi:hypothetical protein
VHRKTLSLRRKPLQTAAKAVAKYFEKCHIVEHWRRSARKIRNGKSGRVVMRKQTQFNRFIRVDGFSA